MPKAKKSMTTKNTTEFKIESDIPIATSYGSYMSTQLFLATYPVELLGVGQSFFVPCCNPPKGGKGKILTKPAKDAPTTATLFSGRMQAAKQNLKPKDFAMRTLESGVRVWRIK